MTIDKIAEWIWNTKSIDEYFDNELRDKTPEEQLKIIDQRSGLLKEWLQLKIKWGIGIPVVMYHPVYNENRAKGVYHVLRDYEAFCQYRAKYPKQEILY